MPQAWNLVRVFGVPMKHVSRDRPGAKELDEPTAELLKAWDI